MSEPLAEPLVTAELVAKIIAATPQVGQAQRVLEQAGYTARVTGNKIAIAEGFEAHLIFSNGYGWWNVFASDGTPPVWMVGTTKDSDPSLWIGCVE